MTNEEKVAARNRNAELKAQINQRRVVRDSTCFIKTESERLKLSQLEKSWKIRVSQGYQYRTMKLAG